MEPEGEEKSEQMERMHVGRFVASDDRDLNWGFPRALWMSVWMSRRHAANKKVFRNIWPHD